MLILFLIVRVGGGYLSIEQFLDQCYYFQSEKMARSQSKFFIVSNFFNNLPNRSSKTNVNVKECDTKQRKCK